MNESKRRDRKGRSWRIPDENIRGHGETAFSADEQELKEVFDRAMASLTYSQVQDLLHLTESMDKICLSALPQPKIQELAMEFMYDFVPKIDRVVFDFYMDYADACVAISAREGES